MTYGAKLRDVYVWTASDSCRSLSSSHQVRMSDCWGGHGSARAKRRFFKGRQRTNRHPKQSMVVEIGGKERESRRGLGVVDWKIYFAAESVSGRSRLRSGAATSRDARSSMNSLTAQGASSKARSREPDTPRTVKMVGRKEVEMRSSFRSCSM
jgi:hypothetical protein